MHKGKSPPTPFQSQGEGETRGHSGRCTVKVTWQREEVQTCQSSLGKGQDWLRELDPSTNKEVCAGDLNGGKAVTCLLFSSGICGSGLVRSSGDGGTGPSQHTPRNLKPESPPPSSLALLETDKDGAGYWGMVLGFILLGNDGLVLPVSCGRD